MKALIVEDNIALCQELAQQLQQNGYVVDTAHNSMDAQYLGEEVDYNVVVLDLGLPGKGGLEVLRSWRSQARDLPVLILTARDNWRDKVDGLKIGADDYLTKPFHVEELLARLEAIRRRHEGRSSECMQIGDITLDTEMQQLMIAGQPPVALTGVRYRLLHYLMTHHNKLVSKEQIQQYVYDLDSDKESNVIEVHINYLRKLLGKQSIETRRGQGYVFKG